MQTKQNKTQNPFERVGKGKRKTISDQRIKLFSKPEKSESLSIAKTRLRSFFSLFLFAGCRSDCSLNAEQSPILLSSTKSIKHRYHKYSQDFVYFWPFAFDLKMKRRTAASCYTRRIRHDLLSFRTWKSIGKTSHRKLFQSRKLKSRCRYRRDIYKPGILVMKMDACFESDSRVGGIWGDGQGKIDNICAFVPRERLLRRENFVVVRDARENFPTVRSIIFTLDAFRAIVDELRNLQFSEGKFTVF